MRFGVICLCILFVVSWVSAVKEFSEKSAFFAKDYDLNSVFENLIPLSKNIKNEQCRNHSALFLQELRKMTLWATEMFDACAKFPSGILVGSTYDFGNFDECIQVKVPLNPEDYFSGKYCLATIKIEPPQCPTSDGVCQRDLNREIPFNGSAWDKIISLSQDRSKRDRNIIYWGFCIPSSCTEKDLEIHLQEVANFYNNFQNFKLTVNVNEKYCQTQEKFKIEYGDIIFLLIVSILVLIVLACSFYDLLLTIDEFKNWQLSQFKHEVIVSFSIIRNVKKIFSCKKQQDNLDCIHGLKVYSMALVIFGHRIMFFIGVPVINTNYAESFYTKVETMVMLNGPIIVDTFFSISGFLAAYLILQKRDEKSKNSNFLFLYFHRFLRLTPVYALILAFYCTIFVKLGNGPLWKERIGVEQERCIASWWANLLYLNNYVNTEKICMFQSWYITCDMHLFLVTPFIIWLLRKSTKIGIIFLTTLTFLSMLSAFLTTYFGKLDGILLLYINTLKDPTVNDTFKNIYIPTHTRASPYLVGIATGYLLHRIQKSEYKIPKRLVYIGWTVSTLTMLSVLYSAYIFYIPDRPYDPYSAAVYSAFHHFLWSICISWFILAISTGNSSFIQHFLSWKPLSSFSKITYTAFLCHGGIQLYTAGTLRTPMTCSIFNLIWYSLGDIALTFTGALVLTTFFESPIIGIEKMLLGSHKKPQQERWQKNIELKVENKATNGNVTPLSFIHVNSA